MNIFFLGWLILCSYLLNFFNNVTLIREVFRSLPAWGVTKNTRNIIYGKLKTKFPFMTVFDNFRALWIFFWCLHNIDSPIISVTMICYSDKTIKKGRLHYQNTIIVDHLLPYALGKYTIRVDSKIQTSAFLCCHR